MNRQRKYIYKSLAFLDDEKTTQLLNGLKEIAKRDGWSFSKLAHEAFVEYLEKHSEGNPQLKIASYLPTVEKSPMRVVCFFLGGATSEGKVLCRRGGLSWISAINCYSCPKNELRKKKEL